MWFIYFHALPTTKLGYIFLRIILVRNSEKKLSFSRQSEREEVRTVAVQFRPLFRLFREHLRKLKFKTLCEQNQRTRRPFPPISFHFYLVFALPNMRESKRNASFCPFAGYCLEAVRKKNHGLRISSVQLELNV